jgi:hypothetical protein
MRAGPGKSGISVSVWAANGQRDDQLTGHIRDVLVEKRDFSRCECADTEMYMTGSSDCAWFTDALMANPIVIVLRVGNHRIFRGTFSICDEGLYG